VPELASVDLDFYARERRDAIGDGSVVARGGVAAGEALLHALVSEPIQTGSVSRILFLPRGRRRSFL